MAGQDMRAVPRLAGFNSIDASPAQTNTLPDGHSRTGQSRTRHHNGAQKL